MFLMNLTRKQKLVRTPGFFFDFFPQLILASGSSDRLPVHLVTMVTIVPGCLIKLTRKQKMLWTLGSFLERHQCKNCQKYSLDKCSACKWAHYCSVDCQDADFEEHSKVCKQDQKSIDAIVWRLGDLENTNNYLYKIDILLIIFFWYIPTNWLIYSI